MQRKSAGSPACQGESSHLWRPGQFRLYDLGTPATDARPFATAVTAATAGGGLGAILPVAAKSTGTLTPN